jgi:tRNA (cytidine/uridine-2'-O-)-methyltransferase
VHVVLVQPEIAPNTGNVIRLCANTGSTLHLVEPLGFRMDDRDLKRAGLDYHEFVDVVVHPDLESVRSRLPGRWFAFSSGAERSHAEVTYEPTDVAVFGAERHGLSPSVLATIPLSRRLRIPMRAGNRSLNLANAVAVVVYEAWRQVGFEGSGGAPLPGQGTTSERPGDPPFDR